MATINILPDEIMIDIFAYLTPKMIKNCNLVCKRWNEIIINSSVLMNNYVLRLKSAISSTEEKHVQRNIQTMIAKHQNVLDVTRGYNLRSLTITGNSNMKQFELIQALNCLKSLKKLSVYHVNNITTENFQKVTINLQELCTASSIVHIFDCKTLKHFQMSWQANLEMKRKVTALRFLNEQKSLKDFGWYEVGDDFFRTLNSENFKSQFSLERFVGDSDNFERHDDLIFFLDSHRNSLKDLNITLRTQAIVSIERIQKHVLENLSQLKNLNMFLHVQDDVRENSEPMMNDEPRNSTHVTNNIEYFGFRGLHRSLNENARFIGLFGNLKHLYLDTNYNQDFHLLNHISITKIGLESLYLHEFLTYFVDMPRIYFPNIKKLSVNYLEYNYHNTSTEIESVFSTFIAKHAKTLEEIIIRDQDHITTLTIDAIAQCKKLKYLEFDVRLKWINGKVITCPRLKSTIKLLKDLPSKYPRLTLNISSNTFKFPDDKIFWDELFPPKLTSFVLAAPEIRPQINNFIFYGALYIILFFEILCIYFFM